jgi:hypothetical protein
MPSIAQSTQQFQIVFCFSLRICQGAKQNQCISRYNAAMPNAMKNHFRVFVAITLSAIRFIAGEDVVICRLFFVFIIELSKVNGGFEIDF